MSRALTALLLALFLTACGGSDSPEDVSQTFFNSLADGNAAEACAQLSDDGRANIVGDGDCEEELLADYPERERTQFADVTVQEITEETEQCDPPDGEDDARVEATLAGEAQCVDLIKVDDTWQIEDF